MFPLRANDIQKRVREKPPPVFPQFSFRQSSLGMSCTREQGGMSSSLPEGAEIAP